MKLAFLLFGILIIFAGCTPGYPFHTAMYYQPGKTFQQAQSDCEACKAVEKQYQSPLAFRNCMEDRGYKMYPAGQLYEMRDRGEVIIKEDFWFSRDIVGDIE